MKDEAEFYNELSLIVEKYKDVYMNFNDDLSLLYYQMRTEVEDYTNTK